MSQLISIIVPVYNVEDYLPRCLDSILNQTHREIEIIAINDGSTDSSGEILDEYAAKDARVKVIHQENKGVSSARLCGIHSANGDWIGFVDADDYIEPDMYKTLYENAVKYNAEISHCGHRLIHLDGNVHYFYNTNTLKEQDTLKGVIDLMKGEFVEPTLCSKLFKRTLILDVLSNNVFDTSIKYNEDLLLNFLCFSHSSKSVYFDVCPYHYLARETSATRKKFNYNKIFDPIKVRKIILDLAPNDLKSLVRQLYLNKFIDAYSILCLSKTNEYTQEKQELLNTIRKNKKFFKNFKIKRRLLVDILIISPTVFKLILKIKNKVSKKIFY